MSKSPIPFPKNWDTMTNEERKDFIEKNFFRPIRINNTMSAIVSAIGLIVLLL
jgi:hypothetical protein